MQKWIKLEYINIVVTIFLNFTFVYNVIWRKKGAKMKKIHLSVDLSFLNKVIFPWFYLHKYNSAFTVIYKNNFAFIIWLFHGPWIWIFQDQFIFMLHGHLSLPLSLSLTLSLSLSLSPSLSLSLSLSLCFMHIWFYGEKFQF